MLHRDLQRPLVLGLAAAVVPRVADGTLLCYADPARFSDEHVRQRLDSLLSVAERERMAQFRFERDQHLYRVAHALLRALLARELGRPPETFAFVHGERGRPELAEPPGRRLRFNLSHTHGLVACGLCFDEDIGVDVEHIDRRVSLQELAQQVLAAAELEDFHAHREDPQRRRFFEFWTLKEAYLKAVGQGIGAPLRSISFQLPGPPPVYSAEVAFGVGVDDQPARLRYRCWPVGSAHQLALAVGAGGLRELNVRELDPAALFGLLPAGAR